MRDVAISVIGLSKRYLVGHDVRVSRRYAALRDVVARSARNLARKTRDMFAGRDIVQGDEVEEFWALRNVSFEVKRGDRIGIVGRNGAGKSTLLKLLSRITEPTRGRIAICGRVASLLEVGTGFHPELTGRENIYLNGAILGMTRAEIRRKFDAIVTFAEVERFLDTPVKRYSSGMYVRLAFAVAAHIEPEILIVDEVLAVGDSQFQQKCIGKMRDVGQEGRTVLFVSHNMVAVKGLCTRAILLRDGELAMDSAVEPVLAEYQRRFSSVATGTLASRQDRRGDGRLRFVDFRVLGGDGQALGTISAGQAVRFRIDYHATEPMRGLVIALNFYERDGEILLNFNTEDVGVMFDCGIGLGSVECSVPFFPLRAGSYMGNLFCTASGVVTDWVAPGFGVRVEDGDIHGSGRLVSQGRIACKYVWSTPNENRECR